jgi:hypothetical protein
LAPTVNVERAGEYWIKTTLVNDPKWQKIKQQLEEGKRLEFHFMDNGLLTHYKHVYRELES